MNESNDMNLTPEDLRLQEAIRGLGEVRAEDSFHERLRREFIAGDIATVPGDASRDNIVPLDRGTNRRGLWVAAIPVLAAILAFVFLTSGDPAWTLKSVTGTGTIQVDGQSVEATDAEGLADLVQPGARFVVPATAELELILGEVMVFGIIRDSDVTIPGGPEADFHSHTATVAHGELLVKTGPAFSGEQLLILTSEGRIELTGTTIAVNKGDGFTCVCVLEGTARIGKDIADLEEVVAGYRKVMFADGSPSIIVDIEPGHEKDLTDFEARNKKAFE
jgi:ferric-dicitrate binding protein FerR (iron transport regulator)